MTAPRWLWPRQLTRCRVSGAAILTMPAAIVVVAGPFRGDDGPPAWFVHAAGEHAIARVHSARAAWRLASRFARVLDRYERRRPFACHQHAPSEAGNVRWRVRPDGRPVPVLPMGGASCSSG